MQSASSIDYRLHFLSIHDEIKWLKVDADMGFTNAQHRLGVLYLESASDTEELYQAYKWLFISVALGNDTAKDDLVEVNKRLDYDQIDEAYLLAERWFEKKFDDDLDREECNWSPELMKWRFALPLVH
jgi:TPR repeat protein